MCTSTADKTPGSLVRDNLQKLYQQVAVCDDRISVHQSLIRHRDHPYTLTHKKIPIKNGTLINNFF